MRTNIELDNDLVERAKEMTGIKTKRGVVEEGLRTLIRLRSQEVLRKFRGKVRWEGDLNEMREGRYLDPR
jgi:Arc/MetJ family transcription regulator